jgi:2-haloacid dehalogenase
LKYRWLLFDADGTLFDCDKAEVTALADTFQQSGLSFEPTLVGVYREINAALWLTFEQGGISQNRLKVERFEQLCSTANIAADPQALSQRYLQNLSQSVFLVDGALEVIEWLHSRFKLLIITNGLKIVQRPRFDKSALRDYFAGYVISEEVGSAKPGEKIFDVAFEQMAFPAKDQVLIIGDSLTSDMAGGLKYGIDTCWFNPDQKPVPAEMAITYVISDLRQLADIVKAD